MKLLIVLSYGTGFRVWEKAGIISDCLKLIRRFASIYEEVWIFGYDNREEVERFQELLAPNVRIISKPRWVLKLIYSLLWPLLWAPRLRTVKLIRTWQLWGSWTAIIFKLLLGCKLLLRQGFQFSKFAARRSRPLYYMATIFEKLAYKLADKIVVTRDEDKQYIIQRYKIRSKKITVIPNWVDIELFKPMKGVAKEANRIIFVGRLEKQKNVLSLVRAVKTIPNAKLYIFGSGSLENEIRKEIEDFSNIHLMGVIPHEKLPYELNKSEIFILPSLYEGHPKALLEAMACGLPVIGSKVEGVSEIIEDGVNGLLCDPTPEDIRRKIICLLSDRSLRERLGRTARSFIVKNYSFEKAYAKELEIHRELLLSSS